MERLVRRDIECSLAMQQNGARTPGPLCAACQRDATPGPTASIVATNARDSAMERPVRRDIECSLAMQQNGVRTPGPLCAACQRDGTPEKVLHPGSASPAARAQHDVTLGVSVRL